MASVQAELNGYEFTSGTITMLRMNTSVESSFTATVRSAQDP